MESPSPIPSWPVGCLDGAMFQESANQCAPPMSTYCKIHFARLILNEGLFLNFEALQKQLHTLLPQ